MKRLALIAVFAVAALLIPADYASAQSLKIAPLKYESTLEKGEKKKGFVDVSNPSYEELEVKLSVQSFRIIDDDGTLEFINNKQVSEGIQLDLTQFTLEPREAIRVYFLLDGNKLPSGDVFGAIFASTLPASASGSKQSVRVGTLLFLVNGTPSSRIANVTDISGSWLQIGEGLKSTITLNNPAEESSYTGFFPDVTVKAQPYHEQTVRGPLLFAGRSRTIDYIQDGNYFGPIRIAASAGGEGGSQWVFAVTGYWRWLAPLIVAILAGLITVLYNRRSLQFGKNRKKRT